MGARGDGHAVRADLVCRVAVRRDPVRSNHDRVDFALRHDVCGGVVADQRDVDAGLHQLPRGKPRALQEWARFVGKNPNRLPLLLRHVDRRKRGAVLGGREAAGVAVRENREPVLQERRPVAADRAAHCGILVADLHSLFREDPLELARLVVHRRGGNLLHALQRPEKVDRRRPRLRQVVGRLVHLADQGRTGLRVGRLHGDHHAHRRRDADGRRAAHLQRLDRAPELLHVGGLDIDQLARQLRLVDHPHAAGDEVRLPIGNPFYGFEMHVVQMTNA